MSNMAKLTLASLIAFCIQLFSCKQNEVDPTTTTPISNTTADIRDSLWLYMQDVYLWYDKLPSSFNPYASVRDMVIKKTHTP